MSRITDKAWDQHLEEMNRRPLSCQLTVSLVRIEPPYKQGWGHQEHVHPYWQLGLVEDSGFSVSFGTQEVFPEHEDILLIPPQNWHHFHHQHGQGTWTIKFAVAELGERYPVGILPRSVAAELLYRMLLEAVQKFHDEASSSLQIMIECMIVAVLNLYFSNRPPDGAESEMVRQVRTIIEESGVTGKPITVSEIASRRNCTAIHLNRVFKRRMGVPIKVFIDQCRFETARKLLLSSKLNITEIAAEMGFDDVFRFSRFFKRLSGEAPLQFRKRNGI